MKIGKTARYLNLLCGKNKGYVFTVDALIAVVIAVMAIAASSVYVGMSSGEPVVGLQMSRTSYDILNIISYKGLWPSQAIVETELSSLLPVNYAMVIKEQCDTAWNNFAKANTASFELPVKKEIITGERMVVKEDYPFPGELDYCRVRFYVWLK